MHGDEEERQKRRDGYMDREREEGEVEREGRGKMDGWMNGCMEDGTEGDVNSGGGGERERKEQGSIKKHEPGSQ